VERTEQGYRLGDLPVDVLTARGHGSAAERALAAGDVGRARDEARAALAVSVSEASPTDAGPLAELRRTARREADLTRQVLGRALDATGEHAEAFAVLEPLVAAHPADETLLVAMLRSEAAVRGAPAALARYERHRRAVRDALGTDPGPALQRLHGELLAQDRPVRAGVLHDATRLIGRDDDVAALAATIRTSRVTSILGPGGLGKTRLAHVMGRLAEQPVVHFVELAGVGSPDDVAVEVGSALGVRDTVVGRRLPGSARDPDLHARILEQIGAPPTLLILDNCEHVVEAVADLVAVLVARAPQLRVLTTTRAPLGLAAERVYALPQLAVPDAVALFRERATAARPGVRLDDAQVAALVERLDGLPLAVELAAAKVRVMSVDEIEKRLEDRFALLRGGSRDAPARHQTLLAVIDWSWHLLDAGQRRALRRLAAFRDGFSLDAAAEVVEVEDALPVVAALVDQSLVVVHDGEALRYRLLETVREFGLRALAEAGEEDTAHDRVRRWAVGLATRSVPRLFGRDQVEAMAQVRAEEGNLVGVLHRGVAEDDVDAVVVLMAALTAFWTVAGDHLKVVNVGGPVEALVVDAEVPDALQEPLRGVVAALVMNGYIFAGRAAPRTVERLRALGPGEGDPRLRALVRLLLLMAEGEGMAALGQLDHLCADPDPAVARLALQWTSQARENAGDVPGALSAARQALALADEGEGPWTVALLTSQLAGLALQSGDHRAARDYALAAMPDMQRLGADEDVTQLRALLAFVAIETGALDEAAEQLARVAEQPRGQALLGGAMVLPCGLAELALARGDVEQGLLLYRQAVEQMRAAVFPGLDRHSGYEPWVLYPEAGALAAHARHRPDEADGARLRDELARKAGTLLARPSGFLDFPVVGAVAFALSLWELRRPGTSPEGLARAVRLLALADRLAYSRMLPVLSWPQAAAVAEQQCPGVLDAARAELAPRPAVDLRQDVADLVAELG
jgi:predicted ATPase/tetratricopeptide (TPR) repeat protein